MRRIQTVTVNCRSGKRAYLNRKEAKRSAREHHDPKLAAFRCPICIYWHLGHLPKPVIEGKSPRSKITLNGVRSADQ